MKIFDREFHVLGSLADAGVLLLQPVDEAEAAGLAAEAEAIRAACPGVSFALAGFEVNWFEELSPWDNPPVYGREAFGHGAAALLDFLLKEALPDLGAAEKRVVLGGYSLAGLFALWCGCETNRFAAVGAASPSVWFPGWAEYAQARPFQAPCCYLSLGRTEERSRHPLMRTVGDAIRAQHRLLTDRQIKTTLEWNEGGHFNQPEQRMAKAFAWVLQQVTEQAVPGKGSSCD